MNGLREKIRNKKGFTLVEMLIVVAIIAILIAVSIPMINSNLEKARQATDDANKRAALGMAMIEVMSDNKLGKVDIPANGTISAFYKVSEGKGTLEKTAGSDASFQYGQSSKDGAKGICVKVTYDVDNEEFTAVWANT